MTSNNPNPRPFEPPLAPDGSSYVLFQGNVVTLMARRQTDRMRAAGIDARWESNRNSGVSFSAEFTSEWLCNVFVAQPHLICAMILWRLSFRGIKGWQKMSPEKRARMAGKALVDTMLLHGGGWDPAFFTPTGLNWLQMQLNLGEEGFQRVLGQARRDFNDIARRDLHWGLWLTAGCFIVGGAWWMIGSLTWQVLILLVLGIVFGVHTLALSWPSSRRVGNSKFGASHPPLEKIQTHLQRVQPGESAKQEQKSDKVRVSQPYLDLGRCLQQARAFLNQNDAESALNVLENFAADDYRGVHTAYPEFYEILRICQQSLGKDTRNTDSQIEEMRLDWMTALNKGQQLLKAGKAQESIAYFERSLKDNPGEYGTASAVSAAEDGIKAAKALLRRQKL